MAKIKAVEFRADQWSIWACFILNSVNIIKKKSLINIYMYIFIHICMCLYIHTYIRTQCNGSVAKFLPCTCTWDISLIQRMHWMSDFFLNIVFAVSYRFWYCFIFISRMFLFQNWFLQLPTNYSVAFSFNFQVFMSVLLLFLLLASSLIPLGSEKICSIISIFFNVQRFGFVAQCVVYLRKCLMCCLEDIFSTAG